MKGPVLLTLVFLLISWERKTQNLALICASYVDSHRKLPLPFLEGDPYISLSCSIIWSISRLSFSHLIILTLILSGHLAPSFQSTVPVKEQAIHLCFPVCSHNHHVCAWLISSLDSHKFDKGHEWKKKFGGGITHVWGPIRQAEDCISYPLGFPPNSQTSASHLDSFPFISVLHLRALSDWRLLCRAEIIDTPEPKECSSQPGLWNTSDCQRYFLDPSSGSNLWILLHYAFTTFHFNGVETIAIIEKRGLNHCHMPMESRQSSLPIRKIWVSTPPRAKRKIPGCSAGRMQFLFSWRVVKHVSCSLLLQITNIGSLMGHALVSTADRIRSCVLLSLGLTWEPPPARCRGAGEDQLNECGDWEIPAEWCRLFSSPAWHLHICKVFLWSLVVWGLPVKKTCPLWLIWFAHMHITGFGGSVRLYTWALKMKVVRAHERYES